MAVTNVVPLREPASAPAHLTEVQARLWDEFMQTSAGNLIAPEAFPVLVEYCRAIEASDQVAKMLNEFDPAWVTRDDGFDRFSKLRSMADRLSSKIASLSVKLRISPSTRILPRGAGRNEVRAGAKLKPWETGT